MAFKARFYCRKISDINVADDRFVGTSGNAFAGSRHREVSLRMAENDDPNFSRALGDVNISMAPGHPSYDEFSMGHFYWLMFAPQPMAGSNPKDPV